MRTAIARKRVVVLCGWPKKDARIDRLNEQSVRGFLSLGSDKKTFPLGAGRYFAQPVRIRKGYVGGVASTNGLLYLNVKDTILNKKIIRSSYFSSENRISQRVADPLCLLFRERAWYLCVYDRKSGREMVLRASRIRGIQPTGETFERVMQQDPMATPDYAKSYALERVVLRIQAEYAFRVFDEFPEQDIHPEPDGSYRIDELMPINEWLTGYLLSFAEGLEVMEPSSLRDTLLKKIKLMAGKYDRQVSGSSTIIPS